MIGSNSFLKFDTFFSNSRDLAPAELGQLWNLYGMRIDFEKQVTNLDTVRLCVGEPVILRLGSSLVPTKSEDGFVIRLHEGEEERVDVQMNIADMNGKVQLYSRVSRKKISRPQFNFCDDSRWVEAAAEVTGFEPSEVFFFSTFIIWFTFSSHNLFVTSSSKFSYPCSNFKIPERLKRMEQGLKKITVEMGSRIFPAYLDHPDGKPPVSFPLCPVMWK